MSLPATPYATSTITLVLPVLLQIDMDTYWRQQLLGVVGTLAAPVAAGDTTVTVSLAGGVAVPAFPFTFLVDSEPMTATGAGTAAGTWNVTRGTSVSLVATPTTHASGANITALQWLSVYALLGGPIRTAITGWSQQLATQGKSLVFGSAVSGTLSVPGS